MDSNIPTSKEVQTRLLALNHAETQGLADSCGVPFTTLWKIRTGETKKPGLETVRLFWPELVKTKRSKTEA